MMESSKPRSFFTPKKLYMMQQKQQEELEKTNRESATSTDTPVTHGGRGEKKLPESFSDDQLVDELPPWEDREREVLQSPMKRSRGKTGKHLRLLAALDKDKAKNEELEDGRPMEDESERASEPGWSGHGEAGKRAGRVEHAKVLQVKKQCDKNLSPGKDMHALMGTTRGRGRGRGRGRPPKSSNDPRSRYPSTEHSIEDTAQVFNVNAWEGGHHHEKGGGPTQIPTHRRPSVDTGHDGPLRSEHGLRRRSATAIADDVSTHRTQPSDMCDEITSSGDTVRAVKGPVPSAGQLEPLDKQANDLSERRTNLIKVEPDSQRVGNMTRGGAGEQHSCMVCGDIAAGFHCGAYVCEACKKFFVRCLKQDVGNKFMCSKSKMCVVNRETRTQCQFCRYQKCLSLGMYKPGSGPGGGKFGAEISHIPCKVCESPSSGYHFGAITCEGCKGFFRRTVKERSGVRYVCSRSGACNITINTRNVCKSCRYQKCLQAGMTPDGSRIGRQPNAVKHATMLELQRLGCGSTPNDTSLTKIKQEEASPPSENQDSGFPDNAQFEMIDPSNLPEEFYLTQSEEEGKLRAITSQPLSPSEILDSVLVQSEPDNLKLYTPVYSHAQDVMVREQAQFSGHREPHFGGHYAEASQNPHTISPQEQGIPQPRSFRESRPMVMKTSGTDIRHQPMLGYSKNEEILRREQVQREQAQLEQAQLEQAQRELAQREQAQREQAQLEQAQKEQAQRDQAQREQAQKEQAQREQAQREQAHRDQAHREQAHREQAHRDQAHREQAHRDQVHREQVVARGQSLQLSPPVQLDPSHLQLSRPQQDEEVYSPEYLQHLARIEVINAQQQELKRQQQQKALELKMEISKLASHSKYMLEISHTKATGARQQFVNEKPLHGKPLSAAAMELSAQQPKAGPSRATSMDNASSYTSPDSAHFSMSPEDKRSPFESKTRNEEFEQDWCGDDRNEPSKDCHGTSLPRPDPPVPRRSPSIDMSPLVLQTDTLLQMPTDLSTRSVSQSDSGVRATKTSGKDCFEIINRVPNNHKLLLESITKASLFLIPILEKSPDCKEVDLNASVEEMWDTMMGQFNQCAKAVINFARRVPGFLQFSTSVQITKVQMAMYPIVLTVLSTQYNMETKEYNYFHMSHDGRQMVFKLFPGFTSLRDHFHSMGHSIKFVEMDDIEVAFLCAVVLMTSEAAEDGPKSIATQAESDLIEALHIYCIEKEGANTNRDGYILARLAEVNRCNAEHQKAVFQSMMMHPNLKVPQLFEETYLAM